MPIDSSILNKRRELGKGGFGIVYEVETPAKLVGEPTCAFKEYLQAGPDELANLQVLVDFRNGMSEPDRDVLDHYTTWPLDTVVDNGSVVGFLMRLVPQHFIETSIAQVAGTASTMRSLSWLAKPGHARNNGGTVVEETDILARLRYCAWMAHVMQFLHARNMVYGDLSVTNILWSTSEDEPIMFIDMDPVRIESRSPAIPQANSPNMESPEKRLDGQSEQDEYTDRYKLALLIYFVLASKTKPSRNLSHVTGMIDAAGLGMLAAGLSADKATRPSAMDWYRYFYAQICAQITPPEINQFAVSPAFGMRGENVEISWDVTGYRDLTLHTPWGTAMDINVSASNTVQISLDTGGRFRLVAVNDHGAVEMLSQVIHIFEPPQIRFVNVPSFESLGNVASGIDVDSFAKHFVGAADSSWMEELLGREIQVDLPDLLADRALLVPRFPLVDVPDLAHEIFSARSLSRAVDEAMSAASAEMRGAAVAESSGIRGWIAKRFRKGPANHDT